MKNVLKALAKVKTEMESVKKTSNNPFFKSKYANLNSHLELIEPLLEKNGLLLLQPTEIRDGRTLVTSKIYHIDSGEVVVSEMIVDTQVGDMQKAGAGVTYGRRFTLNALVDMIAEDLDAEDAVTRPTTTKTTSSMNGSKATFAKTTKPTVTTTVDDF
jgi:hypothetical protein